MAAPFNPPLSKVEIEPVFPGLEVVAPVKAGAQGATFYCLARRDNRPVALKIYGSGPLAHPERVRREIAKLKLVDSPHVMKHHGDGEATLRGNQCLFLIAEWIDGTDLKARLDQPNPEASLMDEREVLQLINQGAKAVESLSAKSVIHRDINPNNLMRRPDGTFVLIDLGLAKHLDMRTLTDQGVTFGTPGYISPELFYARFRPSFRSDLFSLGVVAYEMASGAHPFGGDQRRCAQIQFQPVRHLSHETNALLQKLMSPQPLDRARSCEEVYLACES
jgi:serine/threonine-protein kinase